MRLAAFGFVFGVVYCIACWGCVFGDDPPLQSTIHQTVGTPCDRFAAAPGAPLCKQNLMRWCQTDLAATAYRWRKLVGRDDAGGQGQGLLFGDLDQGISHDGLMAQEVVKRGWKVGRVPVGRLSVGRLASHSSTTQHYGRAQPTSASLATTPTLSQPQMPTADPTQVAHVSDACLVEHAPSPQVCALKGRVWDDRHAGSSWAMGGGCFVFCPRLRVCRFARLLLGVSDRCVYCMCEQETYKTPLNLFPTQPSPHQPPGKCLASWRAAAELQQAGGQVEEVLVDVTHDESESVGRLVVGWIRLMDSVDTTTRYTCCIHPKTVPLHSPPTPRLQSNPHPSGLGLPPGPLQLRCLRYADRGQWATMTNYFPPGCAAPMDAQEDGASPVT
jgi:hypothetical protein